MKSSLDFWKHKRVLATGGNGFFGSHIVELLQKKNPKAIVIPQRKNADLRNYDACLTVCKNIDIVLHLAGNVGGIGYNQKNPATLFDDNILMGVNMVRAAHASRVKKFVGIGTVCSYPKYTSAPFVEDHFWDGYPEETNAAYGLAKKALLTQLVAYRSQYGFNGIYLVPENLYGPRDNFDARSSHVIPAIVRRMVDAKRGREKEVTIWGTGRATREFLYVTDAARAVLFAAERYNKVDPVNIGAQGEISIRELAEQIAQRVGYGGKIVFDGKKPDGQPRRALDTSRAWHEFGFRSKVTFPVGLDETIRWYVAQNVI